jgi:hypothetical protein
LIIPPFLGRYLPLGENSLNLQAAFLYQTPLSDDYDPTSIFWAEGKNSRLV